MMLQYGMRLVCLALAGFFLLHLALALLAGAASRAVLRRSTRLRPRSAARLLLALRLAPAGLAALAVCALCVPSYLRFETETGPEEVGVLCLTAGLLGLSIWVRSIARTLRASVRSLRLVRDYRKTGRQTRGAGLPLPSSASRAQDFAPFWVIETPSPVLVLSGIFHPEMFISSGLLKVFSPPQLEAAVRHERAHWARRDNLKRLLVALAPDPLPGLRAWVPLEREWSRLLEWAADDWAVAGNARLALSLASALLRAARMGPGARPLTLASSLLAGPADLSARVERLVNSSASPELPRPAMLLPAILLATALAAVACLSSAALAVPYAFLESLVR